ncbi:MAG: hypothetical protein FJ028_06635, partial [Chloroflexi bacterium]|nr:hypothetical protein [Chloroflexota bacterium]
MSRHSSRLSPELGHRPGYSSPSLVAIRSAAVLLGPSLCCGVRLSHVRLSFRRLAAVSDSVANELKGRDGQKVAALEALTFDERRFPPPDAFRAQANWRDERVYAEAERDLEGFWARHAEAFTWSRRWDRVLAIPAVRVVGAELVHEALVVDVRLRRRR